MSLLSTDIIAQARSLLNDLSGNMYSDTILGPYIAMAWDQLSLDLALYGVDTSKNMLGYGSNAVASVIVPPTTNREQAIDPYNDVVSYPDMLYPVYIDEKLTGTSDENYTRMVRQNWDNGDPNTAEIKYWVWKRGKFFFRGPTTSRTLRIAYISSLGTVADTGVVTLWYAPAKAYLVFKTASLAALYIGENPNRSAALSEEAEASKDKIIGIAVKGGQALVAKHKPFKSFRSKRLI